MSRRTRGAQSSSLYNAQLNPRPLIPPALPLNSQIRARIAAALVVCLLAPIPILYFASHPSSASDASAFHLLGLSAECNTPASLLWPLAATLVLFSGALATHLLYAFRAAQDASASGRSPLSALVDYALYSAALGEPTSRARDLIFAPLTEEWAFRACTIPALVLAGFSPTSVILLSLLSFGVAHLHHFFEKVRGGASPVQAAVLVLVQFTYTGIFGAMSAYFYLSTWSFVAVVLPHAFCNAMGLPPFGALLTPSGDAGGRDGGTLEAWQRGTLAVIYAVGIVAFFVVCGQWAGTDVSPCSVLGTG
jgi:prenyl protein peptidase